MRRSSYNLKYEIVGEKDDLRVVFKFADKTFGALPTEYGIRGNLAARTIMIPPEFPLSYSFNALGEYIETAGNKVEKIAIEAHTAMKNILER